MEGEMIMMQDLFEFKRAGLNSSGKVLGAIPSDRNSFGVQGPIEAYGYNME